MHAAAAALQPAPCLRHTAHGAGVRRRHCLQGRLLTYALRSATSSTDLYQPPARGAGAATSCSSRNSSYVRPCLCSAGSRPGRRHSIVWRRGCDGASASSCGPRGGVRAHAEAVAASGSFDSPARPDTLWWSSYDKGAVSGAAVLGAVLMRALAPIPPRVKGLAA